ncbi:MAG: hypothetical protein RLZZ337_1297, partial [Bacteroidota bacterium]
IEEIELIGIKKVDDGFLIISDGSNNKSIDCTKVGKTGEIVWKSNVEVPNLGGYNFNMLQVFFDTSSIYIMQQLSDYTIVTKLDKATGDEIYDGDHIKVKGGENPLVWLVSGDKLYLSEGEKGFITLRESVGGELMKKEEVIAFNNQFSVNTAQVFFSDAEFLYSGAYALEPNHGTLHLAFNKYNPATGQTIDMEHELVLEHTSYTYNSQFDLNVFGITKGVTGFYMVGKLDYHFNKPYPTTKMGDNHIGIWVAKFDFNLNLVYMSELPYQYFTGLIPADMVQRPAVIDLKEDANQGLFVAINELQGVIYGNKYFLYLDSLGMYHSVVGGKDGFNILEYDNMGLRDAGRRNRVRLMSGNWSPYVTSTFLFANNRPQDHSQVAENLITLKKQNKHFNPENWSYNYLILGNNAIYLEYGYKKGGMLNIYVD